MKGSVRLVLFDLGETLWQRNWADWPHLQRVAHRRAGALLREVVPASFSAFSDESLGGHLHQRLDQHRRALVERSPDVEPDGPATIEHVLRAWDLGPADRSLSSALFAALDVPVRLSRVLLDDTLSGLAALRDRGLELGVVTNRFWGGPVFVEGMRALGLLKYFDAEKMAVSADLGVRKPAAAIYRHALIAHQAAPEEAAMVGNSLPADVAGAQRMGILAAWKPGSRIFRQARTHLFGHGLSIRRYNEGERPCPAGSAAFDETEHLRESDRSWRPFLQGAVHPDLIVERTLDLIDVLAAPVPG